MLDRFKEIFSKGEEGIKFKLPRHIAIVTKGKLRYAKKHNLSIEDTYNQSYLITLSTISSIVKLNIPVLTFYFVSTKLRELEHFSSIVSSLTVFFNDLSKKELIHENKIKISVLGKWYDLPGTLVDSIKNIIDLTKNYDGFFVNFCINYDGQEEIIDAIKLISRQIKGEKIDRSRTASDLLLWDTPNAKIHFTNKLWPDFDKIELMDAIREYQKGE